MQKWQDGFILQHRVAHLATVDENGQPYVIPIVYAYDGQVIYTPIDEKPKRVGPYQLRRVRNIQVDPHVALIIDDYSEDWQQLAWVQIRGTARLATDGNEYEHGIQLLAVKYPQYKNIPLQGRPIILIQPEKITGWQAREA